MSQGDPTRGHRPDEPQLSRRPAPGRLRAGPDERVAVDTGGTFTDFVRIDRDGIRVFKLPSTPRAPEEAILEGLGREPGAGSLVHGSTVATNALLERRGARTALVTTAGFEDVLVIGRQARPALYDIRVVRPEPLVPPRLRLGVRQRTRPDGSEEIPLDPEDLEALRRRLGRLRVRSVAVSLLFSFEAPAVEQAIRDALEPLGVHVSLSSQILPEYREYERTSTTVVNAYLAPVMDRYLDRLERGVRPRALRVMQSNGGAAPSAAARSAPVRTILSGPAGGVVAALGLAARAGYERIISFDMGGTSTDVALLDGDIATTRESTVDGMPVGVPMMDIHSVGAGGGSIAALDAGGALQVGPRSAGADPGPACYGRGSDLTVTDANLLLGRLRPAFFLGGEHALEPKRVDEVVGALGWARQWKSARGLASGVVEVVNNNMMHAIRVISVERGYDVRDFTLVCFGGAGGLHAAALAGGLGIPRVLVPPHPGALSALGLLLADARRDYSQSLLGRRTPTRVAFDRVYARLHRKGIAELGKEGFSPREIRISDAIDVRYSGQSFELTVPYGPNWESDFHGAHEQRYGYANRGKPLEVVAARTTVIGPTPPPRLPVFRRRRPEAVPVETARVWSDGRWRPTPVFDRARLGYGAKIPGPAVIGEYSSTTWTPPAWRAEVDRYGNLILERKGRR